MSSEFAAESVTAQSGTEIQGMSMVVKSAEPTSPASCPHCNYVRGSNWRACAYCRIGMCPQPTATARVIASQLATIDELRAECARLRALVNGPLDPDSEARRRRPDQEPR